MSAPVSCADLYQAVVYVRGGARTLFTTKGLAALSWSRRLDETSDATITIVKAAAGPDCCAMLGQVQPWAHEIGLFRDGKLVWQGPIVEVTESRTTVQLDALDVLAYLDVRVNAAAYNFTAAAAIDWARIGEFIVRQAFAADDPNVLAYLEVEDAGADGERSARANTVIWGDELRDIAHTGIDYTTVGRKILISGNLAARLPRGRLGEDDFADELELVLSGAALSTQTVGTGTDGAYACTATAPPEGIAYYGLVQRLVVVDDATNPATTCFAAQNNLASMYPLPALVRVPDGATLAARSGVRVQDLVCGQRFDVALTAYCRKLQQAMRLIRVTAEWSETAEAVKVALAPMNSDPSAVPSRIGGVT